jgi:RNA polymerase sigma factor (TIGR02999 family)
MDPGADFNKRPADDVTRLLAELSRGNASAMDQLVPLIYPQLRELAAKHFRRERRDHTLQATALVNEAYLRLVGQERAHWEGRIHFLSVASVLMRRILVDHARKRGASIRPGSNQKVDLEDAMLVTDQSAANMLAIDEALLRLAAMDAQQARVVELRFFGGLSVEETAQSLRISTATVKRDWSSARAWLYTQVKASTRAT